MCSPVATLGVQNSTKYGSVGRLLPNTEAKIVDADGKPLGPVRLELILSALKSLSSAVMYECVVLEIVERCNTKTVYYSAYTFCVSVRLSYL